MLNQITKNMLNNKVEEILNAQIEKEGYSSHLYLAMASWAESEGYPGIAKWLYAQSEEEREHMLRIIAYVNEREGHASIPPMKDVPKAQKGIREMFESILEHERYISKSINEIVDLTLQVKDYTTHNWVQWFVSEQIEEEAQVVNILDKLKLLGGQGWYIFDRDIMSFRDND